MKKIVQAILLFIPYLLFSQSMTLDWEENKIIYAGEDSVEVLSFAGAAYTNASFLPYYNYRERLNADEAQNYDYSFNLTHLIFSEIDIDTFIDIKSIPEEFQIDGKVTSSRQDYALEAWLLPFKYKDGKLYRLESFELEINKDRKIKLKSASTWFADNSLLATGNWYKVAVKKDGIYKLSYSQLRDMGVDPAKVAVFTKIPGMEPTLIQNYIDDIKEIAIYDGGDYILFYAQGPNTWNYNSSSGMYEHEQHLFWNENYYFITSDVGEAKRITARTEPTGTSSRTYTTFVDYDFYEPEESNIGHSGREWYSDGITSGNSIEHTFSFDNVVASTAKVGVRVLAESYSLSNYLTINIDGNSKGNITLGKVSSEGTSNLLQYRSATYDFTPSGNSVEVQMSYSSQENLAKGYIDYFRVELSRELSLENSYLLFRNKPVVDDLVNYEISNTTANTLVWDVSNAYDVKSISASINANKTTFLTDGTAIQKFVAVNIGASFSSPSLIGSVENQNLHATPVPDMVILTDETFMSVAEDLADIHRERDGMDIFITTQDKIFNEFSGGKADVSAIRWFMKMLYDKSADTDKFKYLLLLGDGSYNNRLYEKGTDVSVEPSRIMTYQSIESINGSVTYVSDDYYGLLDDDEGNEAKNSSTGETNIEQYDKVDIGIGRIPINSVSEGDDVVTKIETYLDNVKRNTWKNRVCFIADDEDSNRHLNDAEELAEKVRRENPGIAVKKIYLDAFEQIKESNGHSYPDAKKLSDKYLDEGTLIWSYTGHGSPSSLSGEKLMYISDINAMENLANLPLWVTATCDFCPYDHNDELSGGESVFLNPIGGGIALFTTTRLVYSSSNLTITRNFYGYVLASVNGEKHRLGDVSRLTKQATGTGANKRKFALIGDPALQLVFADADWEVMTDSINGEDIALFSDTLQSLSKMTVSGHIAKSDGSVDTDFNGLLYPIVYDKISELNTLANDDDSNETSFLMWNSILYSGKTTVDNGRFTFSFILPKDMDYTSGKGRIEYYATSDEVEANGYYEDFYLGGFNYGFESDTVGPALEMYMNSPSFSDGDAVNPNPMLIANVSDISGINTSGNAIGHDITIKLNDDPNTIEVINTSYTTRAGDFTQGTIAYSLKDLDVGTHTLQLKVWDMQNNSSTAEITFKVKNDVLPVISSVYSYPNPVSLSSGDKVHFVAEHDRPDKTVTVMLDIFDVYGKTLYKSSEYYYSSTNEIYFDWQPLTSLNSGLYFYRITIDDGFEQSVGKTQKLLLTD